jgi:uroporphyrinogen decarboxylase
MTHRERILKAIRHERCDRIPTDIWATTEVLEKLFDYFGIVEGKNSVNPGIGLGGGPFTQGIEAILKLWDKLGIDAIFHISPSYIGPKLKEENGIRYNEWGIGRKTQSYGQGEYVEQVFCPMAEMETVEEVKGFNWPNPDWYDYDILPEISSRCGGRAISCGYTAIFYFHNMLRGLELSLMDPIINPDITHLIIEKLSDFFDEYHRRCYEKLKGLVDITQVTDDFGSQKGLLISPEIFSEFYKKPMQKAINLAKSYDIYVFHHDDGDNRSLLEEITDMGIDILNPIQWRCGDWDLYDLKEKFGRRICFHGAVDNQETLPFGTSDEVREQVKTLIEILAKDKTGLILAPCHNLQVNTPVENIIALYEAVHDYGEF